MNDLKFPVANDPLDLLCKLVEWFRDEVYESDDYGNTRCFFCAEDYPNHEPTCFYVQAKQMVKQFREEQVQ